MVRVPTWAWGVLVGLAVGYLVNGAIASAQGPTVCRDGWPSSSIGIQGACSSHGGVDHGPARLRGFLTSVAAVASGLLTWGAAAIWADWRTAPPPPPGPAALPGDQPRVSPPRPAAPPAPTGSASSPPARSRLIDPTPAQAPSCPVCGSAMLKRWTNSGPNGRAGYFWGCSTYPACRGTRAYRRRRSR